MEVTSKMGLAVNCSNEVLGVLLREDIWGRTKMFVVKWKEEKGRQVRAFFQKKVNLSEFTFSFKIKNGRIGLNIKHQL